jgi:hypothetical protein
MQAIDNRILQSRVRLGCGLARGAARTRRGAGFTAPYALRVALLPATNNLLSGTRMRAGRVRGPIRPKRHAGAIRNLPCKPCWPATRPRQDGHHPGNPLGSMRRARLPTPRLRTVWAEGGRGLTVALAKLKASARTKAYTPHNHGRWQPSRWILPRALLIGAGRRRFARHRSSTSARSRSVPHRAGARSSR